MGCCLWGRTESDTTEATYHEYMRWRREWQPIPVFLPGESQGQRSLVGCRLWGRTVVHDWSNLAAAAAAASVQFSLVTQLCLIFANPMDWSLFKLKSIKSVMPSNHLILCCPFLCLPPIFPSIRFFPMSQFFESGSQSIGASDSVSVLPMNIQDWFSLGYTCFNSLQSKGLSKVFSNTTVQKHQFFGAQPSLWSKTHIHIWLLVKL